MLITVLLALGAYLLGSVSAAIVVCRLMGLPDPRTEGSCNPGATNVLRLGGKKAAAVALVGDAAKGVIPVLAGRALGQDGAGLALIGFAAFVGHIYPIFFGFRGGKGVATAFGVLLGAAWPVALMVVVTWLGMAKVFKISSLSAVTAAVLAPAYAWWLRPEPGVLGLTAAMSLILLWRHRSNLQRLLSGQEGKIAGQKPKPPSVP